MPLIGADLSRDFLPMLVACDAAPEYGIGVTYRSTAQSEVEVVGALAERRGHFVRFYPEANEPPPKGRLGTPHQLPCHKKDFQVAFSSKALRKAHSSVLEAQGLLSALKWVLRSSKKRFGHRVVVLVDAKAVLGAAAEGRTSAPALRGILRRIAAILLGTNTLLRLLYVPSDEGPADAPSRGHAERWHPRKKARNKKSRLGSRFDRWLAQLDADIIHLRSIWGNGF